MRDLRLIALCNILHKIITKCIENRRKQILPLLITENQSAFVPGRNKSDNVLVAFEVLHYMRKKQSGREGEVALKLDISKIYDHVDLGYLQKRLQCMGFYEGWIKWILMCLTIL